MSIETQKHTAETQQNRLNRTSVEQQFPWMAVLIASSVLFLQDHNLNINCKAVRPYQFNEKYIS